MLWVFGRRSAWGRDWLAVVLRDQGAVTDCHRLPRHCHYLPKDCHRLPKPAITCHGLPVLWGGPWRSRGPLQNSVFNGCVGIVLMGLMLWHIDVVKRTVIRSARCDLLLENEGKGHPRPVTVCHINPEAWRRKPFPRAAGPLKSLIPSLALRAGVRGFMVSRGVFNMSPTRERGDLGRGDLSVGCFGGVGDPRRTEVFGAGRSRPLEGVPHDWCHSTGRRVRRFPRWRFGLVFAVTDLCVRSCFSIVVPGPLDDTALLETTAGDSV